MASFLISPGVSIREVDNSQYTATQPGTGNVAALIGYAEKGSFDPTFVYSQQDFITKFGKTLEDVPYLAQAAYKYFEEGSQLLIIRAGDDRDHDIYPEAAAMASKIIRLEPGDDTSTSGSQSWGFSAIAANDVAITAAGDTDYSASVVVDGGTSQPIAFSLLDLATMTYQEVVDAFNAQLTGAVAIIDVENVAIKIISDSTGTTSTITITDVLPGLVGIFASMTASTMAGAALPGIDDVGQALVTLEAKEKGTYGNKLVFRTETQEIIVGATTIINYNVYILLDGYEVSKYAKVDWVDTTSDNYITTLMANDLYVSIEALDEDDNDTMSRLPDGDWALGNDELPDGILASEAIITDFMVGTNGWEMDGDAISSLSSDYAAAMTSIYNSEVYEFNLVAAPGGADPIVQNAIQALCDSRRDCFGVIDAAEVGLGIGIKSGVNDILEVNAGCSTLSSSYVATYWSWVQDFDYDNDQYVWLPPSIYAMKQMVYTDNVSDPWFAPAGLRRGRVSALGVEYSPSSNERDLLYGDGKIVNPIVNFVDGGITIWGQKTAQRTKSATDRINVRRLLIYAEKLIAKMARGFLFEPHDPANWAAFARQANAILEPIRQRRGLTTYTVVCDDSTNTPSLIDQNIMAGKIFIQPTKAIEFLTVDFTINAASGATTITEG